MALARQASRLVLERTKSALDANVVYDMRTRRAEGNIGFGIFQDSERLLGFVVYRGEDHNAVHKRFFGRHSLLGTSYAERIKEEMNVDVLTLTVAEQASGHLRRAAIVLLVLCLMTVGVATFALCESVT